MAEETPSESVVTETATEISHGDHHRNQRRRHNFDTVDFEQTIQIDKECIIKEVTAEKNELLG